MRFPRRWIKPRHVGDSALVVAMVHEAARAHSEAGQCGQSCPAGPVQVEESSPGAVCRVAGIEPCIAEAPGCPQCGRCMASGPSSGTLAIPIASMIALPIDRSRASSAQRLLRATVLQGDDGTNAAGQQPALLAT